MDEIVLKNQIIMSMLDKISSSFDNLTFESFDSLFPIIVTSMRKVHIMKAELLNQYGIEALMTFEPEIFSTAKLIENKFDNIVRVFSDEESRLEKELMGYAGAKKLINYKRYQNADQRNF